MKILFPIILFFHFSAFCEYRIYQYQITSKRKQPSDPNSYLVVSTLDPASFLSYRGGEMSVRINLIRSWMCKGYTGGKRFCDPPLESFLKNK